MMNSPLRLNSFLCVFLLVAFAGSASADWVGNVRVSQPTHARIPHSERVYIDFDYEISTPAGARIGVQPINEDGNPINYGWSPSVLYTGTGSSQMWFIAYSGDVVVNSVLLYVNEDGTNDPLLRIEVPTYVVLGDHGVFNTTFSHTQPSWLARGENLTINFDAKTASAAGAYVYMRPTTGGFLTPGYGASGGASVPAGGVTSGSQTFTFSGSSPDVDGVRVQMVEAGSGTVLLEYIHPVGFHWREHGVKNITMTPPPPAWLPNGTDVGVGFDYHTTEPVSVRAWAIGSQDGATANGCVYDPSASLPVPTGTVTRNWTIAAGYTEMTDGVRLIVDGDGTLPFHFDEIVPADFHFGPHAIYDIVFDVEDPAVLHHADLVNLTFSYTTDEANGVRIFAQPMTDGALSPLRATAGSPLHASGTGAGSSYFRIIAGDAHVDQVRLRMTNADQSVILLEFFLDSAYFWGNGARFVAAPPDAARMPHLGLATPNPFNPMTTIGWSLPNEMHVRVNIYDVSGRLVRVLVDERMPSGPHARAWDGTDSSGRTVASGVYYYQLATEKFTEAKKMTLVK